MGPAPEGAELGREPVGPAPKGAELGRETVVALNHPPRSFGWRRFRGLINRGSWPDQLLGSLLTSATFLVHDVPYILMAPYWNDEAWVALQN